MGSRVTVLLFRKLFRKKTKASTHNRGAIKKHFCTLFEALFEGRKSMHWRIKWVERTAGLAVIVRQLKFLKQIFNVMNTVQHQIIAQVVNIAH